MQCARHKVPLSAGSVTVTQGCESYTTPAHLTTTEQPAIHPYGSPSSLPPSSAGTNCSCPVNQTTSGSLSCP